jgi:[acyl-carrier-protein] S-malonyltransferase
MCASIRVSADARLAFCFPGQGSQAVGMGKALAEAFPESRQVFDQADQALGFPLSRLCFEGPEEELRLTANTQPAILTASVAAYRALAARGARPDWVAGHSLGEYSALVAAGALDLADAVRTVRRRGEYMQEAVPVGQGAMAAILGLDLAGIEAACAEAAQGQVVAPANINSPGQIVIAGHKEAVARAIEACQARGNKRAIPLPVSAPFHCALMRPAQERLAVDLERLAFRDPEVPLVRNVDAAIVRTARECREGLVRQVSGAVLWQPSIERLRQQGVTTFVEVGPGTVLAGLIRKIDREPTVLGVGDPAGVEKALSALGATRAEAS